MVVATLKELFDLKGKVALITGCKNLGYDAAEALAEMGAIVVLTRRNLEEAKAAALKLSEEMNSDVVGVSLEVTDEQNWEKIADNILSEFGKIDILINNAGGRNPTRVDDKTMEDMILGFLEGRSLEDWKYGIDVNLTSVFLGCKTVIPHMRRQGYGKIINIASIDGLLGRDLRIYKETGLSPTVADYLAGKAGVINLTRGMAVVYAPYGICINSISPGGFFRNQPESFVQNYERLVPLGRMGGTG